MRLIDEEQFITEMEMNIGNIYNPYIIKGMRFAVDLIKSRPTAYDVDKVVEQIRAMEICGRCLNNPNPTVICATFCDVGKRLEIIKAGGVNEKEN